MDAAREMGGEIIHLEVGEPSFTTPAHIIEQAFEATAAGATRYTQSGGILPLRQAIADRCSAKWGKDVTPNMVMASHGGVNAINSTVFALIDRGVCYFDYKLHRAEQAGAIAAVIVQNAPGEAPFDFIGSGTIVPNIPAMMIRLEDGQRIKEALGSGQAVNATLASDIVYRYNDWGYLRLRREEYTPAELDAWATRLATLGWKDAFVSFKHKEAAPLRALDFLRRFDR